jgi:23S rRNA pseudouridine1911/1915/1917 synthase
VELIVPADAEPMRLDRFVVAHLAAASRRRVRLHAAFLLNGRPARRSTIVHAGDRITVPDVLSSVPRPKLDAVLDLLVLFEDPAIVAVDKPPGVSSVALEAGESQTVAAFLAGRYPEMRDVGPPLEAGLVHRLDRETSGVILAARTPEAYADLRRQFDEGTVNKEYIAVVYGQLAGDGVIDLPIAHDPRHRRRMLVCPSLDEQQRLRARPARTQYQPIARYHGATLVRLRITTGVRHQIRVHLAHLGHAVVGDRLYGPDRDQPLDGARHALHASGIEFHHPVTRRAMRVESAMSEDLEALVNRFATLR